MTPAANQAFVLICCKTDSPEKNCSENNLSEHHYCPQSKTSLISGSRSSKELSHATLSPRILSLSPIISSSV